MELIFYLTFLPFFFAQTQNTWRTVYSILPGLNETDNWNIVNSNGGPFSDCYGSNILGGYSIFGKSTWISLNLKLPPHYSVRISLTFWKVDSWDGEMFQLIYDNQAYKRNFWTGEGGGLCGNGGKYKDLQVPLSFTLEPHYSESFVVIMTSSLDEDPSNVQIFQFQESWGVNQFLIEILECPEDCFFCYDYSSNCKLWYSIASYWQTNFDSEGWLIDNNENLSSSLCANIQIVGGTNLLRQGQYINKLIENVPKHFKAQVVLKLWALGDWNEQNFIIKIDEQDSQTLIQTYSQISLNCVNYLLVNINNIVINALHSSPQIKLELKTEDHSQNSAFWGVSSFDLYIAKCSLGCEDCNGELETECSNCKKKWGFLNGKCIPALPLEYANFRIQQNQGLKLNIADSFQLYIEELNQFITEVGEKIIIIDKSISTISFQIYLKCQEKIKIEGQVRNNYSNDGQIIFSNDCQNSSNIIIYSVLFIDTVQSEKELVLTISIQKVEIIQVILLNNIETNVLLMQLYYDQ
ncbi:unnamed protein product (macronuclear) [Paramecium tetraurelia]|uniref:Uncharacterized protein n=1 Tax=Paramecium tetraurelia TaxID=5888 RepID=A0DF31_PARTE|nr:uncharacterized protein GSPATT00039466001 [Paramecium tetraurelia]CAK81648.1 unnamed protein product [Paramecium tetraurelia]|eukprot:XP_001449045.1 hypothetical protein (macronuclear) [Paramecium tetraurelia strain d4-2]